MNHRGLAREAAAAGCGHAASPLAVGLAEGASAGSRAGRARGRGRPRCARATAPASIRGVKVGAVAGVAGRAPRARAACARSTTSSTPPTTSCWSSASRCTPSTSRAWPGAAIVVRRARAGRAHDDPRRRSSASSTPTTLVIADAERAVALAGIMGGADTEIRAGTTDVLLESRLLRPAARCGAPRAASACSPRRRTASSAAPTAPWRGTAVRPGGGADRRAWPAARSRPACSDSTSPRAAGRRAR